MNVQSIAPVRRAGRHAASGAAILLALFGIVPVATIADQHAATTAIKPVAEVSLSDLDLPTPEGLRVARDRLQAMAERLCAEPGGGRSPSSLPSFGACVDSAVASALRHIDTLTQTHARALNSVTVGASVSLADLDLSTLEGAHVARQRLESMARRLCDELARRQELAHQGNYAACVRDSLAGALAQADTLAAARNSRTARRSAP